MICGVGLGFGGGGARENRVSPRAVSLEFLNLQKAGIGSGDMPMPTLSVSSDTRSLSCTVLVLIAAACAAADPLFAATFLSFDAGNNPQSVAMGDLNGDGRPDLAIANYSSNTVSALLNSPHPPTVNAIPDQTVAENQLLTVTPVGNDPDGDPLTWWGANLPAGVTVSASTGVLTWTPTGPQVGIYPNVTITANDGKGGTASASFQITVTLDPTAVLDEKLAPPTALGIAAVRPSPFARSTELLIGTPAAARVVVTVWSVTGRCVATLSSAKMKAGYALVRWNGAAADGRSSPGGVYVVRVEANGRHAERRVVKIE